MKTRFDMFNSQKIRIFDNKNEPLNENIYFSGCILRIANGYLNDYCVSKRTTRAAVEFSDAYVEHWKDGNMIENEDYYYKDTNTNTKYLLGKEAEIDFADYLNENNIPFIHLDQLESEHSYDLCSKALKNNEMKRPDYIIFEDKTPYFVDVKLISLCSLNNNELLKLNKLESEYSIKVFFAIKNKKEKKNEYSFLVLENMINYKKIFHEMIGPKFSKEWEYYHVPVELLSDHIAYKIIQKEKMREIFFNQNKRYNDKKNYYSNIFIEYLEENNYYISSAR